MEIRWVQGGAWGPAHEQSLQGVLKQVVWAPHFEKRHKRQVWEQYYLQRGKSLNTTLAFPTVLPNIISQDLEQNLIFPISVCCNAHPGGLLKDKAGTQMHKTTRGCSWHQAHWGGCQAGTACPQGTRRLLLWWDTLQQGTQRSWRPPIPHCLHLPGDSSDPRREDSHGTAYPTSQHHLQWPPSCCVKSPCKGSAHRSCTRGGQRYGFSLTHSLTVWGLLTRHKSLLS